MEYKVGELYRSNINNRLFEIANLKKENGRDYIIVKNVEARKTELKEIEVDIETFKRLQLTKVN